MRIRVVILAVLALALTLVFLGSAAIGGESRQKATLKLTGSAPLALRGANFRSRERVRVTLSGKVSRTKHVTASAGGAFVVRFQATYDRCSVAIARAVGDKGSRAALKLVPVACPAE